MGDADSFELKDSGERETFETGSRRDTRAGKGRYDLVSPIAMRRLALLLERGALKYGERNWEKGQPLSRYLDSAVRHLFTWIGGDRSEDHVVQAMWNCMAYVHTEEMLRRGHLPPALDDANPVANRPLTFTPTSVATVEPEPEEPSR